MADAASELAAEIAELKRRLAAVERGAQLSNSTVTLDDVEVPVLEAWSDGAGAAVEAARLAEYQATIDAAYDELAEAAADRDERLSAAEDDLADAADRLADAEELVDSAITTAEDAAGKAEGATADAQAAQAAVEGAVTAATAAQATADQAAQDAAEAAGLAASASGVLIQSATPAADKQKASTLWIDTTGGKNTPKRWTGSAWEAVTDQAAIDAANAAAAAKSQAAAAATAASAAQTRADSAHTLAGAADANAAAAIVSASAANTAAQDAKTAAANVSKNLFSTGTPAGTAPYGSTWFQVNSTGEVIGQWQQTASGIASTWTTRPIRSEVISNLDVGKLTAGTATIATVVAQKIAASTAAFQTVDVGNLYVTGTSTVATQVAQQLYAAKIAAGKILADEVLIGGGSNILTNPNFADGARGWGTGSAFTYDTDGGYNNTPSVLIAASTSQTGVYLGLNAADDASRAPVTPGTTYRVSAWARGASAMTAANRGAIYVRWFDGAGTALSGITLAAPLPIAGASVWVKAEGQVTAPDGAAKAAFGLFTQSTYNDKMRWCMPTMTQATDASLIVQGAIDGQVVTGATVRTAAAGARVEMNTSGLKAYDKSGNTTVSIDGADGTIAATGYFVASGTKGIASLTPVTQNAYGRPGVVMGQKSGNLTYPILFGTDPAVTATDGFVKGTACLTSGETNAETTTRGGRAQLELKPGGNFSLAVNGGSNDGGGIWMEGKDLMLSNPDGGRIIINGWPAEGEATWTKMNNASGWLDYSGGGNYRNGMWIRRFMDNVQICGMVKSGAVGSKIVTLPVNLRPTYAVQVSAIAAGQPCAVYYNVAAGGTLDYLWGPAAPGFLNINLTIPLS